MKIIDERALENDAGYRFSYLTEFMGFSESDVQAIIAAGPLLAEKVPALVDAVYDKLFSYDATKRHFVPMHSGYTGPAVSEMNDLTLNHPAVKFRKEKLARYLTHIVAGPYDSGMIAYLNMVGKIHTDRAGSTEIVVPLVQMNALMGFFADALLATIAGFDLPDQRKTQTLRAFNKLLWLQNDLIARHYQR